MIEHIDRVPTKPNRYAVYEENHNFLRYEYHERADEPVQAGNPFNKALQDEFLAASGTTAGTASALTLAQPGFVLADGAAVRIKLHVDSGAIPTLNINGTGAKAIASQTAKNQINSFAAGTWVTLTYSAALNAYVVQGFSDKLLEDVVAGSVYEFVGWRETPPSSPRQYMTHPYVAYRRSDNTFITGVNYDSDIATSTDACRTYTVQTGSFGGWGSYQTMRVWHPTLGLVVLRDNGTYSYGTDLSAPMTYSPDTTLKTYADSNWKSLCYVGNCLFAWCPWNSGTTGTNFGVRASGDSAFQLVAYPLDRMRVVGFAFDGTTYYLAGNNTSHSRVLYSSPDGKTWTQVTVSNSPSTTIIGLVNDDVTGDIYGVFTDSNYTTMQIGKLTQKSPAIFTKLGNVGITMGSAMVATHCMHIANKFYVAFGISTTVGQWQSNALWFNANGDYSTGGMTQPLADNDSFYGYISYTYGYYHSRAMQANTQTYTPEYVATVTGVVSQTTGWVPSTNVYLGFRPKWVLYMLGVNNIVYISEASQPSGYALTPVGFTASGAGSFIAGR